MINNRQNGRRRGRGGQQARNGQPGTPDRGNRLDNRARGNAAQLLEKYKTLARDAQMQGDRVNSEYYFQFADHYFRVLSENRARFEEQRPPQNSSRDEFGGDDDGDNNQRGYQGDQGGDDNWDDGDQPQAQPEQQRNYAPRQERPDRQERPERQDRPERQERQDRQPYQGDGNGDAPRDAGNRDLNRERGRRNGNNNNGNSNGNNGNGFAAPDFLNAPLSPRFEADRGSDESEASDSGAPPAAEAAPKVRRPRRPRGEAAPVEA